MFLTDFLHTASSLNCSFIIKGMNKIQKKLIILQKCNNKSKNFMLFICILSDANQDLFQNKLLKHNTLFTKVK